MNRTVNVIKRFGFFLLVGIFFVVHSSFSQWVGDPESEAHTRKGIDDVYDLKFDGARAEFKQIVNKQPDHPAGYFFLAMVDWWRIITDFDNTSYDERFLSELDHVIDLCDQRLDKNENDVAALFFKGGALGFRGRLHGNREDWVKAANDGRSAMPIVQKAYKLAPENKDILLGIGIYNYYAEIIPDKYSWVKPFMIFFPKGDKAKGIKQLHEASEHAAYANVEATYFLLQLLQNYEERYSEALPIAQKLYARYPNNVIFHKYVGRCLSAVGRWNDMHDTYGDIQHMVEQKKTGYDAYTEREAHYYLGLYEMNGTHYDAALSHFYRADELSRTLDHKEQSGFMVMTNLKIGMIYDMQQRRDLASMQYNKVLKMNDYQGAHNEAERYLKTPFAKN
ncbi:MAG: tetratricopeptide repeat protein [Ignavibacteriae bacterium]|nr:tetratricopeptide repeat protein [Ignavibacteria bacterium]MBI3363406.1 tetratricopeptide repeat protein [Ignavibacteriota bacterium]